MLSRKELKTKAKESIKGNVFIFFGLTIIVGLIISVSSITVIAPLIIAGPFTLGMTIFILDVIRNKKGEIGTVFKGFNQFGPAFGATFFQGLFIFLWSLLFYIPGIIATFRYSMTYFILADNPGMKGIDAIRKSKQMMVGHKWELFCLGFSFFWWFLLCGITFGIAYIYVAPYMFATFAEFYESLKNESAEKTANPIEE